MRIRVASPGVTAAIAHYVRRKNETGRCGARPRRPVCVDHVACLEAVYPNRPPCLALLSFSMKNRARTPTTIRLKPNAAASPWVPPV